MPAVRDAARWAVMRLERRDKTCRKTMKGAIMTARNGSTRIWRRAARRVARRGALQDRAGDRLGSPARWDLPDGAQVMNLCANNYLGLADHPEVIAAAHAALDRYGFGMASVRFICGTQEEHKELEARIAGFSGRRTRSFMPPRSTPIRACSRRCWGRRMRSSAMRSTMPASSTGCACARRSGIVTPIATWPIWSVPAGGAGRAAPDDRHRWRVLDGWLLCPAGRDLRSGGAV